MQRYGGSSRMATFIKIALIVIAVIILFSVFQKVLAIAVSVMTLAALAIAIWLVVRFLSRGSRR